MKRLTVTLATVLAALAALFAIVGTSAQSASTYRVDAIFDTAKGVIPGQLVKVAGARVGTIEDVLLTEDYKARIVMDVPRRFTFREDAACNIQPEGLISENFVQCVPGTPGKPELAGVEGGDTPTVPVERTQVPVSITDLFRVFEADIRQRFTVAVAAVGGGLAARGAEMNDIIRRANPTLAAVRRLTRDLAAQKAEIRRAVTDTDAVIAELAGRGDDVQDFIDQSQRVTAQTADKRSELAEGIRRLPRLLDQTDAAISDLNTLTREGRPLLGRLRAAAPGVERLVDRLAPFARAARPNLSDLSETADIAQNTIKAATPVVSTLRTFARAAGPTGTLLNDLLINLRDRGFVENLNLFGYYAAAALSRFDSISHIFPAHAVIGRCSQFATEPLAGCNTFYGGERAARTAPAFEVPAATDQPAVDRAAPEPTAPAPTATATAPTAATPAPTATPLLAPVTEQLQKQARPLDDLTDYLLGP